MEEPGRKKYDAFISYRHQPFDMAVAKRLQSLLENYRPPKGLRLKNGNRIRRIFRDQTELPTSGDLGTEIHTALEESEFLIVICSEKLKDSKWCMEEIRTFKELHQGSTSHILPLLISGEPQDVFPEELCHEVVEEVWEDGSIRQRDMELEPLGADIRADGQKKSLRRLKTEFLRIAAPLLGCEFDMLYQRHQRRKRRVMAGAGAFGAAVLGSVTLTVSVFAYRTALAERQSRSALADSYLRQGQMQTAGGDRQKALMYYASALRLQPDQGDGASIAAAALLQENAWPCIRNLPFSGYIKGGHMVWTRPAGGPFSSATEDSRGESVYSEFDRTYAAARSTEEFGEYISRSADGRRFVFRRELEFQVYDPAAQASVTFPVPDQVNPLYPQEDLDFTAPYAYSVSQEYAASAYAGYFYLYQIENGNARLVLTIDYVDVFPPIVEGSYFLPGNQIWADRTGKKAAVSNGDSVFLFDLDTRTVTAVIVETRYPLNQVVFNADNTQAALSYGSRLFGNAVDTGGFFGVYEMDGELVYEKPADAREPICGAAFHPEEKSLLLSYSTDTVRLWNTTEGKEVCMPLAVEYISEAAFTEGQFAALGLFGVDDGSRLSFYDAARPLKPSDFAKSGDAAAKSGQAPNPTHIQGEFIIAAMEGLGGTQIAVSGDHVFLTDLDGNVLAAAQAGELYQYSNYRAKLSADRTCLYLLQITREDAAVCRMRIDYEKKSLGEAVMLSLHGNAPRQMWPCHGIVAVETSNNRLYLFSEDAKKEEEARKKQDAIVLEPWKLTVFPDAILTAASSGVVEEITSNPAGSLLAVVLDCKTAGPDDISMDSYGVLELWDISSASSLLSLGDGTHRIQNVMFPDNGCLQYDLGREPVSLKLSGGVTGERMAGLLASLSCYELDENQNPAYKAPTLLEDWEEAGARLSIEELLGKTQSAQRADTAEEDSLEALLLESLTGEEGLKKCQDVNKRLEAGQMRGEPSSLDTFYKIYINLACNLGGEAQVEEAVKGCIGNQAAGLSPDNLFDYFYYPDDLFYAMGYTGSCDQEIAQALRDYQEIVMQAGAGMGDQSLEKTAVYYQVYVELLEGKEEQAFDRLEGMMESQGVERLMYLDLPCLKLLYEGDGRAASDAMNDYLKAAAAKLGEDEAMRGLEAFLTQYDALAVRGILREEVLGEFLPYVDARVGVRVEGVGEQGILNGLRKGDFICSIDGAPIYCLADFNRRLDKNETKECALMLLRGAERVELVIDPTKKPALGAYIRFYAGGRPNTPHK